MARMKSQITASCSVAILSDIDYARRWPGTPFYAYIGVEGVLKGIVKKLFAQGKLGTRFRSTRVQLQR